MDPSFLKINIQAQNTFMHLNMQKIFQEQVLNTNTRLPSRKTQVPLDPTPSPRTNTSQAQLRIPSPDQAARCCSQRKRKPKHCVCPALLQKTTLCGTRKHHSSSQDQNCHCLYPRAAGEDGWIRGRVNQKGRNSLSL